MRENENVVFDILQSDTLYIVHFRREEESIGEGEGLHGPSMLAWDIGQLCCILTIVSASLSKLRLELSMFICVFVVTELKFTMLHSGTIISDGGQSERSNDL